MTTLLSRTRAPKCQELILHKGDLIGWRQRHGTAWVGVRAGRIWATRDSEPDDVLLGAGQSTVFRGRGLILVEALEDAELTIRAG
jgi:DUF2917 family protein